MEHSAAKKLWAPCRLVSKFGVLAVVFLSLMCGFYIMFMMGYVSASRLPSARFAVQNMSVVKRILGYDASTIDQQKSRVQPKSTSSIATTIKNSAKNTTVKMSAHSSTKPTPKPKPKTPQKPAYRQETCTNCNLHNFNLIINEPNICATGDVDLLLIILTSFSKRAQRDAIRETWASPSKGNMANVRHVFLFGSGKPADNQLVKQESLQFHDILQEDFVDSYSNLTYKTNMGLKWATSFCEKARYILKIDDDMWANTPKLVSKIKSGEMDKLIKDRGYGGLCVGPGGPIRDKRSKWYASVRSYPSNVYPRFCTGPGYIISTKVAKEVVSVAKNVPFFHLEDIFMAICIKKLGYTARSLAGFHNSKVRFDACHYKRTVMTSHQVTPAELRTAWNAWCM
ncbi:beta-1,3-galactosyltransferase 1-like [Tubulanus polymorphus]|uniref:beta-1,3-galactosyltransferase 1-like n=1 Tax=Tubulanus polymorphus TaxID=672921 RepID=UPI003DA5E352